MAKKKSKEQEIAELVEELNTIGPISPKKKRKKKENPHKREYGIEIVHNPNNRSKTILYKVSIDIGFATAGLTWFDLNQKKVESLYYKKDRECHVKGMKIVDLINLCGETIQKYMDILPDPVIGAITRTQFILEEPLLIAGQRSFSISLYVLLEQLITTLIWDYDVHSVCLVRPGSAKKLLGFKHNEKMPDSEKTKFIKENVPEWGAKNNHMSDSCFSMILTNQELLKEYYPALSVLNNVDYKVYESELE